MKYKQYLLVLVVTYLKSVACFASGSGVEFAARNGTAEGYLSSGIKYYAYSAPWIKGKLAFSVIVKAGSLLETQDEIGVAHFLEHLSATSVPEFDREKTLDIALQGGLDIFKDWVVYTSDKQTIYSYTYSKEYPETERILVKYIRGILSDMVFTQSEVDSERRIILKELKSIPRVTDYPFLRGGYFNRHSSIGDSIQLYAITPEKIKGFYQKWYRPQNIAIIMVGDLPAEELRSKIIENFDDARCVVNSPTPLAHTPLNESNICLSDGNGQNSPSKNVYEASVIYRFPQPDLSSKSTLKEAVAKEMVALMTKELVKNSGNIRYSVSYQMFSMIPNAGEVRIGFVCRDTADYATALQKIGGVVSSLKNGNVSHTIIQQLWSRYRISYANFPSSNMSDINALMKYIHEDFISNRLLVNPKEFAEALRDAVSRLSSSDINKAASCIFGTSYSMLANFPSYGPDFEKRMESLLMVSSKASLPAADIAISDSTTSGRSVSPSKVLLTKNKKAFNPDLIRKKDTLVNGMLSYRLVNGVEVIWDKKSDKKRLTVICNAGIGSLRDEDRFFMQNIRNVTPQIYNIDSKTRDKIVRQIAGISAPLEVMNGKIQLVTEWNTRNEEFVWQYLSEVYRQFRIDDPAYNLALKSSKIKKNIKDYKGIYAGLMLGMTSDISSVPLRILSKEKVNEAIRGLLVPSQTRVYLQGNANIETAIAYLASMPMKKSVSFSAEKLWRLPKSASQISNTKVTDKTYQITRLYSSPLGRKMTIKDYMLQGMLEEYLNRQLLIVFRNQKELIYGWNTASLFRVFPEPFTALSMQYMIVPDLLNESLRELDVLCKDIASKGVKSNEIEGLKRREWNRYLDKCNNPDLTMEFVEEQLSCTGKIWSDEDVRNTLLALSTKEVNSYIKKYLSEPSFTYGYNR